MSALFERMEKKFSSDTHLTKALSGFRKAGGDKKKWKKVVDGHKEFQTAMGTMTDSAEKERLYHEKEVQRIQSESKHTRALNGESDSESDADAGADAGGNSGSPGATAEETPADDDDDDDDDDDGDEGGDTFDMDATKPYRRKSTESRAR